MNPIKFIYRNKSEEHAIRSYLERDLTDAEKWQRHFNHERMRMYSRLHPEYPIRQVDPYLPPATQYGDPLPKGEIPIKLRFLRRQRQIPDDFYLLEFGSTVHGSDLTHSDIDYLYIGDDNGYPMDFVQTNLKARSMQHHGPLMAVPEMLSYWPLDLIPPFMLHGAFDHGEHEKLTLWGTWYHREAVEEFIRSVMFWRSWKDCQELPKNQYESCLFWSMVMMFPCIWLSAMKQPRPKAVACHLVPTHHDAHYIFARAYEMRDLGYPIMGRVIENLYLPAMESTSDRLLIMLLAAGHLD